MDQLIGGEYTLSSVCMQYMWFKDIYSQVLLYKKGRVRHDLIWVSIGWRRKLEIFFLEYPHVTLAWGLLSIFPARGMHCSSCKGVLYIPLTVNRFVYMVKPLTGKKVKKWSNKCLQSGHIDTHNEELLKLHFEWAILSIFLWVARLKIM